MRKIASTWFSTNQSIVSGSLQVFRFSHLSNVRERVFSRRLKKEPCKIKSSWLSKQSIVRSLRFIEFYSNSLLGILKCLKSVLLHLCTSRVNHWSIWLAIPTLIFIVTLRYYWMSSVKKPNCLGMTPIAKFKFVMFGEYTLF